MSDTTKHYLKRMKIWVPTEEEMEELRTKQEFIRKNLEGLDKTKIIDLKNELIDEFEVFKNVRDIDFLEHLYQNLVISVAKINGPMEDVAVQLLSIFKKVYLDPTKTQLQNKEEAWTEKLAAKYIEEIEANEDSSSNMENRASSLIPNKIKLNPRNLKQILSQLSELPIEKDTQMPQELFEKVYAEITAAACNERQQKETCENKNIPSASLLDILIETAQKLKEQNK